jgi:predicted RNA-binding Zn-ribbon protein involved in translation (DUF1610 family)
MDRRWAGEAEAVLSGFKEWRVQHPKATLAEIEAALDARLAVMRARLLEDAALASAAADLAALPPEARPRCPGCGGALALRGPETRHLTTAYEQDLALRRHYLACPACGEALFPPG